MIFLLIDIKINLILLLLHSYSAPNFFSSFLGLVMVENCELVDVSLDLKKIELDTKAMEELLIEIKNKDAAKQSDADVSNESQNPEFYIKKIRTLKRIYHDSWFYKFHPGRDIEFQFGKDFFEFENQFHHLFPPEPLCNPNGGRIYIKPPPWSVRVRMRLHKLIFNKPMANECKEYLFK